MLIPGIEPRKKGARRHTMFFFRLFATPIFSRTSVPLDYHEIPINQVRTSGYKMNIVE